MSQPGLSSVSLIFLYKVCFCRLINGLVDLRKSALSLFYIPGFNRFSILFDGGL